MKLNVLPLVVALVLVGCGSLSFKMGGSGSDHEAADKKCRLEGHTAGTEYSQCMANQGWTVKDLESTPTNTLNPMDTPVEAVAPPAPVANDAPRPKDEAAAVKPVVEPAAPPAVPAPANAAPVAVRGWFKLGMNEAGLVSAQKACATKLGLGDSDSGHGDVVDPRMVDCLRADGWRPFN